MKKIEDEFKKKEESRLEKLAEKEHKRKLDDIKAQDKQHEKDMVKQTKEMKKQEKLMEKEWKQVDKEHKVNPSIESKQFRIIKVKKNYRFISVGISIYFLNQVKVF